MPSLSTRSNSPIDVDKAIPDSVEHGIKTTEKKYPGKKEKPTKDKPKLTKEQIDYLLPLLDGYVEKKKLAVKREDPDVQSYVNKHSNAFLEHFVDSLTHPAADYKDVSAFISKDIK